MQVYQRFCLPSLNVSQNNFTIKDTILEESLSNFMKGT